MTRQGKARRENEISRKVEARQVETWFDKIRQDKTRQDKIRHAKTRQDIKVRLETTLFK